MKPAALARTRKVWLPNDNRQVVNGDAQARHNPPSTLHWKVDPGMLDVKRNVGVRSRIRPDGPAVMVVCGGDVTTLNCRPAGV